MIVSLTGGHEAEPEVAAPAVPGLAPGLPASLTVGTVLTYDSGVKEKGKKGHVVSWTTIVTASTESGYQARQDSASDGKTTVDLDRNPFTRQLSALHDLPEDAAPDAVRKMVATQDHGLDKLFPLAEGKKATGTYKLTLELKSGKKQTDEMVEMCAVADWGSQRVPAGTYDTWRVLCGYALKSVPGLITQEESFYTPALGVIIKSATKVKDGRKIEESSEALLMKVSVPGAPH